MYLLKEHATIISVIKVQAGDALRTLNDRRDTWNQTISLFHTESSDFFWLSAAAVSHSNQTAQTGLWLMGYSELKPGVYVDL